MARPLSAPGASVAAGRARRRGAAVALVVAVALLHAWVAWTLARHMVGAIDGGHADSRRPPPIQVSFVRELLPAAPPAAPPAPPPRRKRPRPVVAAPVAPAASAPEAPEVGELTEAAEAAEVVAQIESEPAASAPAEPLPPAAPAAEDTAAIDDATAAADETGPVASAASGAAPADAAAPPFEWPPSTRLSYRLTGWYRGEVHGSAQVLWLREGDRYQVHLDVVVGPAFAPLVSRRMTSDGELTADGLRPRRYDEETTVIGRPVRRFTLYFDADRARLADGREVPMADGLQDPSSQFVQLTWLWTMQPQRLQPGQVVEIPLALPRRIERLRYEVIDEQVLETPVGALPAVHVRPRREQLPRPGRDLSVEAWFAPTLQYLPVRIVIRQDAENHVDLLLSARPVQAQ